MGRHWSWYGIDEPVQNPGECAERSRDWALIIVTPLGEYAYILVDDEATGKNTPKMFCQRRFPRARGSAIDSIVITRIEAHMRGKGC